MKSNLDGFISGMLEMDRVQRVKQLLLISVLEKAGLGEYSFQTDNEAMRVSWSQVHPALNLMIDEAKWPLMRSREKVLEAIFFRGYRHTLWLLDVDRTSDELLKRFRLENGDVELIKLISGD